MQRIPRLIRLSAVLLLVLLAAFSAARLVFWYIFDNPNDPLALADLARSLYIGLKFDLRLSLLIIAPLLLLGWIKWLSPLASSLARKIWTGYFFLALFAVAAFLVSDFGHYAYLAVRLDSTVLRFLANPLISAQMVWESYSVLTWFFCLLIMFGLAWLGLSALLRRFALASNPDLRFTHRLAWSLLVLLLLGAGIYGKFSWYPLRWSDAFFTTHPFASTLAFNPVLYFYETFKEGGLEYDEDAVRAEYPLLASYLGVDRPDRQSLNFARLVEPMRTPRKPLNVIVVILESLASYKTGLSGNPLRPTPHFDALAADSLYFKNFFTPTAGTARSVFTAVTGLPDVQLHSTSSRNPTIVNQHVILDAYAGYEKMFFLGGSANWGNIRGMLMNNIKGLRLYEEGSYASPRNDVWGISDLNLFREAHRVFEGEQNPFFAVILTSGNHRPYTIPEDNEGFEPVDIPHEELLKYGFRSLAEFNAYRFMDHGIGRFLAMAEQSDYYKNTMFVFFGDHGLSGDAGQHSPDSETRLGLGLNRVPLVIHAPALFPQGEILDTVASEMDLMTTLASITGHAHVNTTLGRDLFNPRFDHNRLAFIMHHASQATIGVVDEEFFFRMHLDGSGRLLQRIHAEDPRPNLIEDHPERARRMHDLTRSLYEATRYIANNNPKISAGSVSR